MSDSAIDFETFEGLKENIQPLKRGRNPEQLKQTIQKYETTKTTQNNGKKTRRK